MFVFVCPLYAYRVGCISRVPAEAHAPIEMEGTGREAVMHTMKIFISQTTVI